MSVFFLEALRLASLNSKDWHQTPYRPWFKETRYPELALSEGFLLVVVPPLALGPLRQRFRLRLVEAKFRALEKRRQLPQLLLQFLKLVRPYPYLPHLSPPPSPFPLDLQMHVPHGQHLFRRGGG